MAEHTELHQETRRFLETYFDKQPVFICAIPPDGAPVGGTFGIPGGLDVLAKSLANHAGAGIYYCANATKEPIRKKPSKDDMGAARGVWADLDPLEAAELQPDGWQHERERLLDLADWMMGLDQPPTVTVDSGSGIQAIWMTEARHQLPDGLECFERLGERVERALGGTDTTTNVDRVLRLPGTTNFPNAVKKSKGRVERPATVLYETGNLYSLADLTELADFLETNPPPVELLGAQHRTNGSAGEPRSGPDIDQGAVSKVIKELEDAAVLSTPMPDDLRGKFETHINLHPEMKQRWGGSTDGLKDTSRSGRDCSMVYFLVNDDFTNVEIAHLLLEYSHGAAHDTEKFGRPWMQLRYIARMLVRARTPREAEAQAEAEGARVVGQETRRKANGEAPPGSTPSAGRGIEFPPGLVGEIAKYHLGSAMRTSKIFAVTAGLIGVSALADNQFGVVMPEAVTPTNLYALAMGATGAGKEGVRKTVTQIVEAGDLRATLCDAASDVALHRKLAEMGHVAAVTLLPDEFGRHLKFAGSPSGGHQYQLMSLIMKLHGLAFGTIFERRYADGKKTLPAVEGPYVVVLGTSTAEEVISAITSGEVVNGTLNRFLVHIEDDPAPLFRGGTAAEFTLTEKCQAVATAHLIAGKRGIERHRIGPGRTVIPVIPDDDAAAHLVAYRDEADKLRATGGPTAPLWGRGYENALRVAGVVAIGAADLTKPVPVTLEMANWAIDWVHARVARTAQMVEAEVADSETDRDVKRIVAYIRAEAAGRADGLVSRGEITRKFQSIEPWKRTKILETIVEAGYVETVPVDVGRQRSATCYRPI